MKSKFIITGMFILILICCIANMSQESELQRQQDVIKRQANIIKWQENRIKLYEDNIEDLIKED